MKKKSNLILILSLMFVLGLSSCNSSKHKAETTFDRIDSLRSHLLTIEDSLLYTWNVMIQDDNEKLSDLSRLLDELKYANVLDSNIINAHKEKVKGVKSSRYYMTKMTSEKIDYYDSISLALSAQIIQLIDSFPDVASKYPFINELIESVYAREANVLRFRVDYDYVAKIHNQFVMDHEDIIDQIDPEYRHTILTLFELPPKDQ
ncbi:MAG: hypothetical protein OEW67_03530 [Cyclobacteriaceae bacterium]|nr:hypothetical protein [Cyclobacteriaceae bacterium]